MSPRQRRLFRAVFALLAVLGVLALGSTLVVFFYNLGKLAQDVRDALRIPG